MSETASGQDLGTSASAGSGTRRERRTRPVRPLAAAEPEPLVLVVDDDASVRRALQRLLASVELEVRTFASVPEFLSNDLPDRPSCLILDIRLPERSGLDLQAELVSRGACPPLIFVTGHGTVALCARALKAGALDFLEKPFDEQDLLDAVHRALDQSRRDRRRGEGDAELHRRLTSLSPRERQVLELVVQGRLNKQIAFELGTAEKTVKIHRARVMKKMSAASLADLVRVAGRLSIG